MKNTARKPRSLGDLVVAIYDEVAKVTDDVQVASRVTAREVTSWLIKTGRPDLALELSNNES